MSGSGQDPESELNEDGQNNLSLVSREKILLCSSSVSAKRSPQLRWEAWVMESRAVTSFCLVCLCVRACVFKPYCNFFPPLF